MKTRKRVLVNFSGHLDTGRPVIGFARVDEMVCAFSLAIFRRHMQLALNDVAEGLATPALPDSYRQVPISGARVFDAVKQEPKMTPRLARGPRDGRPYTLERVTASLHRNPF
jgi:hypothetical protein